MNIFYSFSFYELIGEKTGFEKKGDKAAEKLGIEMKIVANKMRKNFPERLFQFYIFLPAVAAVTTNDRVAAIEAGGIFTEVHKES
jgi:hypothetical protein